KGDKTKRDIIIDVIGKVFVVVYLRQFQAVGDSRTRPNQAGFRARCGRADQLFILGRILESHPGNQQLTAVCFAGITAAFDFVYRESVAINRTGLGAGRNYHHDQGLLSLHHYANSCPQQPLQTCQCNNREFCILPPILFNYAAKWILGGALDDFDYVNFTTGRQLAGLDYADDIAFGLDSVVSRMNKMVTSLSLSTNAGNCCQAASLTRKGHLVD
ncbi:unnamed protein product, partial [Dibothriocephalus latus]